MGKTKKIAIAGVIIFILLIVVLLLIYNKKTEHFDITTNYNEKYAVLRSTLKSSGYFDEAHFRYNEEKDLVTIDNKYNIYIKSGYYLMNIRTEQDEEAYCKVVDAVEMHLGYSKGESLDTCHMIVDGIIDIGGISIKRYDNYKVLSVNYKEKSILYSSNSAHKFDEAISVNEQNYTIEEDNYIFSSLTTTYSNDLDMYSICGNLYNELISDGNFTFELYNDKESFATSDYQYDNDNNEYKSFCVEFKNIEAEPSYFMVHLNK